jgi:hypothetical protein
VDTDSAAVGAESELGEEEGVGLGVDVGMVEFFDDEFAVELGEESEQEKYQPADFH